MKTKTITMYRSLKQLILAGLLPVFILAMASCGKDDAPEPEPPATDTPSQIPGMGNFGGKLQGTPYVFPAGVVLVNDTLVGDNPTTGLDTIFATRGRGSYVDVYCTLYNSGNAVLWNIPAGLTFECYDPEYQNGICAETNSVTLPANDTVVVLIKAYCLNSSRHPSGEKFKLGPVTNSASMNALLELLKNKDVPYGGGGTVQGAVWNISDGDGLSDYNRTEIAGMPNK